MFVVIHLLFIPEAVLGGGRPGGAMLMRAFPRRIVMPRSQDGKD